MTMNARIRMMAAGRKTDMLLKGIGMTADNRPFQHALQ